MKVQLLRFSWLLLGGFLVLGPQSRALVNTSGPSDASAESSPAATPTPESEQAAPAPKAPEAASTPAPDEHAAVTPSPAPSAEPPPSVSAEPPAASAPDVPQAKAEPENDSRHRRPGDHTVTGTEPTHDVVAILGNATADVEVKGAVVAILGNSNAAKDVSDAVVAILGNARAQADVGQSVVAVLGNASANGHVRENVVAVLGNIDLGPHAEIDGDVVCVGGQVRAAPGAIIHGHRTVTPLIMGAGHMPFGELSNWFQTCLFQGRFLAFRHDVMWAWFPALFFLGIYVLFGLVFSTGVRRCAETLEQRPGWTIVATMLTVVLAPLLVLALMVTVFGGVFMGIALLVCAFFGKAALYAWLGRRIYRESSALGTAIAVLIGGFIFLLLFTVPLIGLLAWIASGAMGLGMAVYTLILSMRKPAAPARPPILPPSAAAWATVPQVVNPMNPSAAPGVVAGVQVPVSPTQPIPPASAAQLGVNDPSLVGAPPMGPVGATAPLNVPPLTTAPGIAVPPTGVRPPVFVSAATLPRATFAPRLLASLLDLVLVGFLTHVLHLGGLFLLIYTAYCVSLWAMKATTVGGIICGLKLVRLDDRPIDWTIALIRALGAFLSVIVVGLGFLWVNFDEETQSWHDKIAGTTIVRIPKGHSLV